MSLAEAQRDDLFQVSAAMCDGHATAVDVERLEQLLATSAEARDLYVQYVAIHAGLKWSRSSAPAVDDKLDESSPVVVRKSSRWQAVRNVFTRPLPISVTVAALVMGVLVTAMAIVAVPIVVNYARNGRDTQPARAIVARLTNTDQAVWTEGQVGTHIGSHLVAGHVMALQRGVAEVTFDDGAVVWLEGPCEFTVASSNAAVLQRGKVNARINATARGFKLKTPVAEIIDIGTAFGVRTTAGGTEVQVFLGEVEVLIAETTQRRTLRAGESLRVQSGGNVAPSSSGDVRIALPGFRVPLGNLFDDAKDTSLRRAVATDQFGATADVADLGVHQVLAGTDETVVALHGTTRLDLAELGWNSEWYSPPANDAWKPDATGISTTDEVAREKRRYEEGIGMHANQLVTFDLREIREAGEFSAKSPVRLAIARMGINRDADTTQKPSIHVVVIVSNETDVLGVWVNGKKISVAREGDFWQFTDELPASMTPQSEFASLEEPLPVNARFITLICTGAGDGIGADHGVFAHCALEILPEPIDAPKPAGTRRGDEVPATRRP